MTLSNHQVAEIVGVAKALRAWIDAVPVGVQLPVMPGVDRDWVEGVIDSAETKLSEATPIDVYRELRDQRDALAVSYEQLDSLVAKEYGYSFSKSSRFANEWSELGNPDISCLASRDMETRCAARLTFANEASRKTGMQAWLVELARSNNAFDRRQVEITPVPVSKGETVAPAGNELDALAQAALEAPQGPFVAKVTDGGTDMDGGTDIEARHTGEQIALVEHDDEDDDAWAIINYLKLASPSAVLALIERLKMSERAVAEQEKLLKRYLEGVLTPPGEPL